MSWVFLILGLLAILLIGGSVWAHLRYLDLSATYLFRNLLFIWRFSRTPPPRNPEPPEAPEEKELASRPRDF